MELDKCKKLMLIPEFKVFVPSGNLLLRGIKRCELFRYKKKQTHLMNVIETLLEFIYYAGLVRFSAEN